MTLSEKITAAMLLFGMTSLNISAAAAADSDAPVAHSEINAFFPRVPGSYIGDPMPFSENGRFYIFHLNDIRGGKDAGVHAWHLLSSRDLYHYRNLGEVIPYINDLNSPELLLGTGSVIKADGIYHAWYTAHNQNLSPVESIMHATSTDMRHWTKHPQDTFRPGDAQRANDFRDPHVVYIAEENRYWMLITTRQSGVGVIAKYTSTDLKSWRDEGVLFSNDTASSDANLECPTLIHFGNRWYLSFSDQKPPRLTQYRVAASPNGPFVKPEKFYFDGAGLYAGKLAEHKQRLFVFGWAPTKSDEDNKGDIDWAGNLVAHELIAAPNGELRSVMPQETAAALRRNAPQDSPLQPLAQHNVSAPFGPLSSQVFAPLTGTVAVSGNLRLHGDSAIFSFGMDDDRQQQAPLNVVFDKKNDEVLFYSAPISELADGRAQTRVRTPLSDRIKLQIVIEDSLAVFYINDAMAFSTRMYHIGDKKWAIGGAGDGVDISDLRIRRF